MKALEILKGFVKDCDGDVLGLARNVYEVAIAELEQLQAELETEAIEHLHIQQNTEIAFVARIEQLEAENERLKAALIQHRADLHCGSGRPCGTCKQSAEALGIDVPDRCAQAHIDKQALKRESK